MENTFYIKLKEQEKFEKDELDNKRMNEYICKSCNNTSKNLEIHKSKLQKDFYKQLNKFEQLVEDHNKNIKETLLQKLKLTSKNEKWLISYNSMSDWFYIREESSNISIVSDLIIFSGFKKCYIVCPVCNFEHRFNYYKIEKE